MTSCFLTKLTFSSIEFMHWVLPRNTISSRPRLTNSDLDGFRKRPMSVSILEHLFMSSHADLGSPAIQIPYARIGFHGISSIVKENICGPRGFPCCAPESDQINFPLAIGVGEPCASLRISGQLAIHLRRRTSRCMELKEYLMSNFARMQIGDLVVILDK